MHLGYILIVQLLYARGGNKFALHCVCPKQYAAQVMIRLMLKDLHDLVCQTHTLFNDPRSCKI